MTDEKATTVYKRALGEEYKLRMKSARNTLTEVNKRYPCMPFPLRKLLATGNANKFGLVECTTHGLLQVRCIAWCTILSHPLRSDTRPVYHALFAAVGESMSNIASLWRLGSKGNALLTHRVGCSAGVSCAMGEGRAHSGAHQGHSPAHAKWLGSHYHCAAARRQVGEVN